jgi:peptidoglycan/xylan/chitin deacetylase (PgdA/CDA1 family)
MREFSGANRAPSVGGCSLVFALCAMGCSQGPDSWEPARATSAPLLGVNQITGDSLPPNTVVFTYDDGPDEHTLELAQYLHDQGIHVTFFINGRRLCKAFDASGNCTTPWDTLPCDNGLSQAPVTNPKYYPESNLDKVLALGHRIANHSQDHCHLQPETTASDFLFELKTTQDILDRHICDNVFLFRAPYGEWDDPTAARAQGVGLDKLIGPVNWDVDGQDWNCWKTGVAVDACGQGYLDILAARPNKNGIFLMHDRPEFNVGYAGPLLMAQWIVPKLKAAGYTFATLDDVTSLPSTPCTVPADAGSSGSMSDSGDDGGSTSSSGSAGSSGSSSGSTSSTSGGSSTGSGSGGSGASSGSTSSSGGGSSSGAGSASSGTGSGGTSSGGPGTADGGGNNVGAGGNAPVEQSSGCACSTAGRDSTGAAGPGYGAVFALCIGAAARGARRRRGQRVAG